MAYLQRTNSETDHRMVEAQQKQISVTRQLHAMSKLAYD